MVMLPWHVRPPAVSIFVGMVAIVLHFVYPIGKVFPFPANLVGVLFIGFGIWVNYRANDLFKKRKIAIIPGSKSRVLTLEGPYKISRNPMYLGGVVFGLGVAILFGSLIVLIAPLVLFFYFNFFVIPMEERILEKRFGKKYLDFKKRVRRWI
jgi:protein-S-isoprenylcysteine O-methyltransferase Ste14